MLNTYDTEKLFGYEHDLCNYFKGYDRSNVKYFVSDVY